MLENRIAVPQEWIHYVVNPNTFNYHFNRFYFPDDVKDIVDGEIERVEIPTEFFSYGVPFHKLKDEQYRIYLVFK